MSPLITAFLSPYCPKFACRLATSYLEELPAQLIVEYGIEMIVRPTAVAGARSRTGEMHRYKRRWKVKRLCGWMDKLPPARHPMGIPHRNFLSLYVAPDHRMGQ